MRKRGLGVDGEKLTDREAMGVKGWEGGTAGVGGAGVGQMAAGPAAV